MNYDQDKEQNQNKGKESMNSDQIKGKWDQIKGTAKRIWGGLTDDDFKKAEGDIQRLYGVIEEKFGDTKEAIKAKLDKLNIS